MERDSGRLLPDTPHRPKVVPFSLVPSPSFNAHLAYIVRGSVIGHISLPFPLLTGMPPQLL